MSRLTEPYKKIYMSRLGKVKKNESGQQLYSWLLAAKYVKAQCSPAFNYKKQALLLTVMLSLPASHSAAAQIPALPAPP